MKKVISSAIVTALVLGSVAPATFAASNFSDIQGSYAKQAIEELAAKGILNGVDANHFTPDGTLSRAAFAKIVVLSLGLEATATKSSFSDVTGWAVPYVEAAKAAGLINGVGGGMFNPNGVVTREAAAKILVGALKTKAQLGDASDVMFSDASSISDWAKPFVAVAAKYNLIQGFDGKFDPKGSATRAQAAVLAQRLISKVEEAAKQYAITPGTANLAVGQAQQFKVEGAKNVEWSVSGNGVIDQNGNFVGSAPGSATITALVDGVKTLTQAVTIYGAVSSVKFSVASDTVANGVSAQSITVQAVDANGNPVPSFNGTADFVVSGTAAKYADSSAISPRYNGTTNINSLTFKSGQAQFQIVGGTVAGLTDTVTISNLKDSNGIAVSNYTNVTATYTTVAQKATSIKVTAPKTVSANAANTASVTVEVDDQVGQPMLSGVYGLTANISGVAKYADGTITDKTLSFVGSQANPTVSLTSVQGVTGATTITVSGTGLTSGTATIQSVVTGLAAKLTVANANSTATSNDFVTGTAGQNYTVSTVDANGYPTGAFTGNSLKVYVTKADGTIATNIKVNGVYLPSDGSGVALPANTFTLTDDTGVNGAYKQNVGAYTVVVKDTAASNALTAADAFSFKVNADIAATLALKVANNYVAASNPTTTVSVQVTDKFGNALATAGVPVTFAATGNGSAKAAFNGGSQVTAPTVTVNTNANGVATVTFTAQAYNGTSWSVAATAAGYVAPANKTVNVVYNTVSALKVNLKATANNSTTQVVAGSGLTISVDQLDAYGNKIDDLAVGNENDTIKLTVSNPSAINWPAAIVGGSTVDSTAGTITGTVTQVNAYLAQTGLTAKQAGAVTFTAQDLSVNATSATAGITVVAGQQTGFALYDASGKQISAANKVAVDANKEVALYVKPVDGQGNSVVSNGAYTVNLIDANGGQFRTTSGGAAVTSLSFANGNSVMTVYYLNATTGSYTPSVSYAQTVNAASSTVTAVASTVTAGASNITLTVTPKDQLGNNISGLGTSAFTVASSLTGATPTVVSATETQAGSGVYTVVVTDTKAGTQTLTVSVNGTALTQTVSVTVNPAAAAYSVVTSTSPVLTVGAVTASTTGGVTTEAQSLATVTESTTYTVTVQLYDQYGNAETTAGGATATATVNSAAGRTTASGVSAVTVNTDGTATFTYTSGTALSPAAADSIEIVVNKSTTFKNVVTTNAF